MQSLHLEQNQDRLGTSWETALQRLWIFWVPLQTKWNTSQQCTLTLVKANSVLQSGSYNGQENKDLFNLARRMLIGRKTSCICRFQKDLTKPEQCPSWGNQQVPLQHRKLWWARKKSLLQESGTDVGCAPERLQHLHQQGLYLMLIFQTFQRTIHSLFCAWYLKSCMYRIKN